MMTFREAYESLSIDYGYDAFAYRLQKMFPNDCELVGGKKYIFATKKQILIKLSSISKELKRKTNIPDPKPFDSSDMIDLVIFICHLEEKTKQSVFESKFSPAEIVKMFIEHLLNKF